MEEGVKRKEKRGNRGWVVVLCEWWFCESVL